MARSLLTEGLKKNKIEREKQKIEKQISIINKEIKKLQRSMSYGYMGNVSSFKNMNNYSKPIRNLEKKIGSIRKSSSNSNISTSKKIKR